MRTVPTVWSFVLSLYELYNPAHICVQTDGLWECFCKLRAQSLLTPPPLSNTPLLPLLLKRLASAVVNFVKSLFLKNKPFLKKGSVVWGPGTSSDKMTPLHHTKHFCQLDVTLVSQLTQFSRKGIH